MTATCPAGKEAIGGGVRINGGTVERRLPERIRAAASATNGRVGWIAGGREIAEEAGNWQVVAYAVCAEL